MCPPTVRPGVWLKVSQIDGVRPSSVAAPSIWYAAVAAPHRKSAREGDRALRVEQADALAGCWVGHDLTAPSMIPPMIWRPNSDEHDNSGSVAIAVPAKICE